MQKLFILITLLIMFFLVETASAFDDPHPQSVDGVYTVQTTIANQKKNIRFRDFDQILTNCLEVYQHVPLVNIKEIQLNYLSRKGQPMATIYYQTVMRNYSSYWSGIEMICQEIANQVYRDFKIKYKEPGWDRQIGRTVYLRKIFRYDNGKDKIYQDVYSAANFENLCVHYGSWNSDIEYIRVKVEDLSYSDRFYASNFSYNGSRYKDLCAKARKVYEYQAASLGGNGNSDIHGVYISMFDEFLGRSVRTVLENVLSISSVESKCIEFYRNNNLQRVSKIIVAADDNPGTSVDHPSSYWTSAREVCDKVVIEYVKQIEK